LPPGIVDRPAEVWEALLAISDVAGGDWATIARAACVEPCKVAQDRRASLGVRLLSDLRVIFERAGYPHALHTETIIDRLCNGDEYGLDADAPWADLHGKPLAKRGLASMLGRYNVSCTKVTIERRSLQGYRREHLWDAWSRYLPPSSTPARPELPELAASQAGSHSEEPIPDAGAVLELPDRSPRAIPPIPEIRQGNGASTCRRCGGEGCKWYQGAA
jgi:hypothetical protein